MLEPPDVGNWFSSYEYQSPDPDSNLRVKDSAFTENESQGDGEEVVEEKVRIRGLRPDGDNVGHEEDNHNEEQYMNKVNLLLIIFFFLNLPFRLFVFMG